MKPLRTFIMITVLASTTFATADTKTPPAPAPSDRVEGQYNMKKAPEPAPMSQADAETFLAFFNKVVDTIVANKGDCSKMATALNSMVDTNKDMIAKANEAIAANKKMPKAVEDKLMVRAKEMTTAMHKCQNDKGVQAALMRIGGNGGKDNKAPAPTPPPPPPAGKK